jgi:long-chain acyl-CoA synthetase
VSTAAEPIAADFLRRAAQTCPDRPAVVERAPGSRRESTYAELDGRARRAAAILAARGVAPGERVALAAGNGEAVIVAWFAITYAGGVVVPISTVSAPPEVAYRLDHAGCGAIVFDGSCAALAEEGLAGTRNRSAAAIAIDELDGEEDARPAIESPVRVGGASAAMILYTSGTTGEAKGAAISHAALTRHTRVLAEQVLDLGERDRILGVLPLAHSYGCRMVMLASVHARCPSVLVPRFDAAFSLQTMIDEGITWVPAVPTMYAAWGNLPDGPRPPRLRWCLAAGAPLAEEVARRAAARLGAEVRQAYGMTEATISTLNAPPDERVPGCVGRAAPGVDVRVVDEDDRDVPVGSAGEILLRGQNLMSGYLDDPAATAEALRGGWMHSGDVGRLDDVGRLYVIDRIKDMIIRGGNNVYPSEVEAALARHPEVAEVAVVGRPDDYLGEEIVAIVVPRPGGTPTVAELRDWAASQVSATKVPREYALVESLPLGPSRKVLKRNLRERITAGTLATVRP